MYSYKAAVIKVVDGDTLRLDIDLGLRIRTRIDVRLRGIDTPEVVGVSRAAGLEAKAFVEAALPIGATVYVETVKTEKYGRWLVDVWHLAGETDPVVIHARGTRLNSALVDAGLAIPYNP